MARGFPVAVNSRRILGRRLLLTCGRSNGVVSSPRDIHFLIVRYDTAGYGHGCARGRLLHSRGTHNFHAIKCRFCYEGSNDLARFEGLLRINTRTEPCGEYSVNVYCRNNLSRRKHPTGALARTRCEIVHRLLLRLGVLFPRTRVIKRESLPNTAPGRYPYFGTTRLFPF